MNALRSSWDFEIERPACIDIHPTAVVAREAEIGAGVKIGPYAVIGPMVRLGPDNTVGAHAVIEGDTLIGKGNTFSPHCYVGTPPQYGGWSGAPQRLTMGDGNVVREFASISGSAFGKDGCTRLGNGNMLMAYSHIGHDCMLADDIRLANGATLGGHVEIGSHAWMGGLSAAHQQVKIGRNAFVAAGAIATQDVPPFCLVQGDRARLVGLNEVGLKRAGFSAKDLADLRRAFRALFLARQPMKQRLAKAAGIGETSAPVADLLSFLAGSKRGFISQTRRSGGA
jgi:UDP-N-acetylglucosamine acyltransferase